MSARLHHLDSIRGLAALAVVFHHCLITLPLFSAVVDGGPSTDGDSPLLVSLLVHSPLHLFWDGSEAVLLFFILSGLLLALAYTAEKGDALPRFVLKRICRIYLPYLAISLLSCLLLWVFKPGMTTGTSVWFQGIWSHPPDLKLVVDQVLMLGWFNHDINTASWSLVHEMRISLVFPLLVLSTLRFPWAVALVTSAALSGLFASKWMAAHTPMNLNIYHSCYYACFFVVGILVAKHRGAIAQHVARLSVPAQLLALLLGLFLINNRWQLSLPDLAGGHLSLPWQSDWLCALGVGLLFALALGSQKLILWLQRSTLLWLGRVSYSLYLIHSLVLASLVHGLSGLLPLPAVLCLVPLVSLLLASGVYQGLELPCQKLGHRLAEHYFPHAEVV